MMSVPATRHLGETVECSGVFQSAQLEPDGGMCCKIYRFSPGTQSGATVDGQRLFCVAQNRTQALFQRLYLNQAPR